MKSVYVVTSPELGWDCVVAVYASTVPYEDIEAEFPVEDGEYVISKMDLSTDSPRLD